ncbi:hypothetical protein [Streptomonospora salina]|uniref:DivIVA domain-containing protein n=1 Tax=Streptomonospora salina TaxID=104205 RepID=A0A841E9D2_9ACTN|nr:hypothetical protein [Streptomonospora salina]MBB5999074.1 DivIVA domain-containing protein [Streptomonospora salina]
MTDLSPEFPVGHQRDVSELRLEFDAVLRGYDRAQVLTLLETMQRSIADPAADGAVTPAQARERAAFDVVLRGYDRGHVHTAFDLLLTRLAEVHGEEPAPQAPEPALQPPEPAFDRVLRGYHAAAAVELLDAGTAELEALRSGESDTDRARAAAARLRERRGALPRALRGYDRAQVDAAVDAVCAELESGPGPGPD